MLVAYNSAPNGRWPVSDAATGPDPFRGYAATSLPEQKYTLLGQTYDCDVTAYAPKTADSHVEQWTDRRTGLPLRTIHFLTPTPANPQRDVRSEENAIAVEQRTIDGIVVECIVLETKFTPPRRKVVRRWVSEKVPGQTVCTHEWANGDVSTLPKTGPEVVAFGFDPALTIDPTARDKTPAPPTFDEQLQKAERGTPAERAAALHALATKPMPKASVTRLQAAARVGLSDKNAEVRRAAAVAAAGARTPGGAARTAALANADPEGGFYYLRALAIYADPAGLPFVLKTLRTPPADGQLTPDRAMNVFLAMQAVIRINAPAARKTVSELAEHPDWQVRHNFQAALAAGTNTKDYELLVDGICDPQPEVRRAALHSMSSRPDPQGLDLLLSAIELARNDTERQAAIVATAAVAKHTTASKRGSDNLFARFQKESSTDVQRSYLEALAALHDERVLPKIRELIQQPRADLDPSLVPDDVFAIERLRDLGTQTSLRELMRLSGESKHNLRALAAIRDGNTHAAASAIAVLKSLSQSGWPDTAANTSVAVGAMLDLLGRSGDKATSDALIAVSATAPPVMAKALRRTSEAITRRLDENASQTPPATL